MSDDLREPKGKLIVEELLVPDYGARRIEATKPRHLSYLTEEPSSRFRRTDNFTQGRESYLARGRLLFEPSDSFL